MTTEQLKGLRDAIDARLNGKPWQWRCNGGLNWNAGNDPHSIPAMLANGYDFRATPVPVSRPWSAPEDVPGPVCWVRAFASAVVSDLIVTISDKGFIRYNGIFTMWADTTHFEYSTDRREWKPCLVTEEPK